MPVFNSNPPGDERGTTVQNFSPLERFAPVVTDAISDDELLLERAYHWEQAAPGNIFLTQPARGQTRDWTWAQTMDEVRRMAAHLQAQGWPPGSHVLILSRNCAWWVMADLAIWMAGFVTVPIYAALRAESVSQLIEHCHPVACFLGSFDDPAIESVLPPKLHCIRFPNAAAVPDVITWEGVVASTAPLPGSPVRSRDDLATIVYTSGTTGKPKGVMHRFAAFAYCVRTVRHVCGDADKDRILSYLPLAHIAERGAMEANAISQAVHLFFAESPDTFLADLQRARPTFFFSVPRLLVKFQQGILEKVPQPKLSNLLRIPLVNTLVKKKILRQLGLDRVRVAASGAAPLPLDTLYFFRALGLNLFEGYGMTETGITHGPEKGAGRAGTVGTSIPCVETRISDQGEIQIRSPMNMLGYYRDPEGTRDSFTPDGFFRTGDLGSMGPDGSLRITGRLKEQFKTSKGKYVSPETIEKLLSVHPDIDTCCVMGSGLKAPFAVLCLSENARSAMSTTDGRVSLENSLRELREQVNARLEPHERIDFLAIVDSKWSIENGLLTPTMKVKRQVLEAQYGRFFSTWKERGSVLVWE